MRRARVRAGLVLAGVLLWAPAGRADDLGERAGAALPSSGFGGGSVGIEFSAGPYLEAWNLNERREWLVDGTAGIWWAFTDRAVLLTEFHVARVFQEPSRAAFVNGFTPLLRWRVRRAAAPAIFVDLGPGISWSDTVVPPRGTRFNYLLLAGGGVSRRIGRQMQAIVGARWLHISNNGREGRRRNPDIEAIGLHLGLSLSLAP